MAAAEPGSAEAAMRAVCEAVLARDMYTVMGYFTPEALNTAMALASGMMQAPAVSGYTIDAHEQDGAANRFTVRFHTPDGDIGGRATWALVGGVWRITAISLTC